MASRSLINTVYQVINSVYRLIKSVYQTLPIRLAIGGALCTRMDVMNMK